MLLEFLDRVVSRGIVESDRVTKSVLSIGPPERAGDARRALKAGQQGGMLSSVG